MKKYLLVVSKQEFTSLYKFGSIPNFATRLLDPDKAKSELLIEFQNLPFFDGDEEYIILKVELEKSVHEYSHNNNFKLETKDLIEIIPLTSAAKRSLETKFDSRINFSDAIYEGVITEVENQIEISDKLKGAQCLLEMYIPESKSTVSEDILKESYLNRIQGFKSNSLKPVFFTHLMVYERHDYFPKTYLGYFYDLGEVFAHYKDKASFKGSKFHKFLEKHKDELREKKLSEIISFIEKSDEIKAFKDLLTSNGLKLYLTSIFYLYFKDILRNKDSLRKTNIPNIIKYALDNKYYIQENTDALFMLGGFFGFKEIYDDYYDFINLRIFKQEPKTQSDTKPIPKEKKGIPVKINKVSAQNENKRTREKIAAKQIDFEHNKETVSEKKNIKQEPKTQSDTKPKVEEKNDIPVQINKDSVQNENKSTSKKIVAKQIDFEHNKETDSEKKNIKQEPKTQSDTKPIPKEKKGIPVKINKDSVQNENKSTSKEIIPKQTNVEHVKDTGGEKNNIEQHDMSEKNKNDTIP